MDPSFFNPTSLVPVIEASRGGTLECLHFGAVAVVDAQGQVVAHAGDPHWVTFTRSTLKPLQALPFMQAGGARALRREVLIARRARAAVPAA